MNAHDLAQRLNLKRLTRSWRGRCPACDYPGTFAVREGREGRALFSCASCHDRDALVEAVTLATGQEHRPEPRETENEAAARQRKAAFALRLWNGSEAAPGTLAERYLDARGLAGLAASPALRFRGDTPHPEGRGAGARHPAMIALVTGPGGEPLAIHRTFLRPDGMGKAAVEPAKASLGPVWGGAIRLQDHDPHHPLVIGEGIETSASAGLLMGLPAWAAISAGNLGQGLVLPPDVRRVVIAADPDEPGRVAARNAWARWRAEGREARIATPDGDGDFNDLLRTREAAHG